MTVATPELGTAMPAQLLDTLDPEQRAAASLGNGPALIIAPAGSGKTTTLIARLGVLLARGVPAEQIAVATFNRDAALELSARIASRLAPLAPSAGRIEVRTLHALARQILLDHGAGVRLLSDRLPLLRAILRRAAGAAARPGDEPLPDAATLDTEISAWKVERRMPGHPALIEEYRAMLAVRDAADFDDLVVGAADALEDDAALAGAGRHASPTSASTSSRTWTRRSCAWCGSWPSRSATCSWSVTTTRRSTPGGWPTCAGC